MYLIVPLAILTISFLALSIQVFFTIRYRAGPPSGPQQSTRHPLPMVSILKPVKNIDDEIEKNFESFFRLDYPNYEILFAIDTSQDPVVEIIEALRRQYPRVPARITVTGHAATGNPKIHKLASLASQSRGLLYWVNDANIRVSPHTLKQLVEEYQQKGSKIIFSPIRAAGGQSLGSIIENTYITNFVSAGIISAWHLFKQPITVGKSLLIEKNSLDGFGGFAAFKDYLAEDYIMGSAYTQGQLPISSNFTWVTTINRTTTIKAFYSRMERWAKLRFHLKPQAYLLEILLNPIMLALIYSLFPGNHRLEIFSASLLLKLFLETLGFLVLNPEDRVKSRVILLLPGGIILKDILLFIIYFTPFFSSTVSWRGRKIKIGKQTLIRPLP